MLKATATICTYQAAVGSVEGLQPHVVSFSSLGASGFNQHLAHAQKNPYLRLTMHIQFIPYSNVKQLFQTVSSCFNQKRPRNTHRFWLALALSLSLSSATLWWKNLWQSMQHFVPDWNISPAVGWIILFEIMHTGTQATLLIPLIFCQLSRKLRSGSFLNELNRLCECEKWIWFQCNCQWWKPYSHWCVKRHHYRQIFEISNYI